MNLEIHHGGNSLNNVANLHVTMAVRNCEYFAVLLPEGAQKYGLVCNIEMDRNGLVHAINNPGLGVAIDIDLIQRRKVAILPTTNGGHADVQKLKGQNLRGFNGDHR